MRTAASHLDLTDVSEEDWREARRRLEVIQPLAAAPQRTRSRARVAAELLQLSIAQVYRLLDRYLTDPRLTTLLPARRGRRQGQRQLRPEVENVIQSTIDEFYLTRQKPRVAALVAEVRRRCRTLGFPSPSRNAMRLRLQAIPPSQVTARRAGRKAARDRFGPVQGSLEALWPLSLVQIDHTLVDVIVVDSITRAPIQRPWLTLAIDVYSRCVPGFYLSLDPPSATSVALCLAHAALAKEPWLAAQGVDDVWPVSGIPERLHLDNGRDFHSEALRRGCEQYGIAVDYRPVRTPHYGGHIERLIGTMMGKVHLLPGTTFSDIQAKGDLDPQKTAAMTLEELQRWLSHAIAGVYHHTLHRALGTTPLAAWERGILGDETTPGRGDPVTVSDPRRLLIDFLPIERRLIRRDGVSLNCIHYWSDSLASWVGEPQKMVVRYDPRNLSRIYLLAPDGHYYDLSYRDLRRPPISLWEHRLALKRLREEGRSHVDESAIFRAIEHMRLITDDAVCASKLARRQRERRLRVIQGGRADASPSDPGVTAASTAGGQEDRSTLQPWERMLPVEEWT
jgi:putative transposase